MNIAQTFENASAPYLQFPAAVKDCDRLVVTMLDLHDTKGAPDMDRSRALIIPLTPETEANEVLNGITIWMMEVSALAAQENHASHVAFYGCPSDSGSYVSRRQDFYAEDFLFPDRNPGDAQDFDELMRMLDRDRMGDAMFHSLIHDFGLQARESAPMFWRRDIRICCHPDKKQSQEDIVSMRKTAPAFYPMPA